MYDDEMCVVCMSRQCNDKNKKIKISMTTRTRDGSWRDRIVETKTTTTTKWIEAELSG